MKPSLIAASASAFLALSWQASALDIIVVTNNNDTTQGLVDFLTAEGHTITRDSYVGGPPDPDTISANQLIIVSRETNSGEYDEGTEPADWNAIPIPIISMAPHLMRANRWGWISANAIPGQGNLDSFDPYPDTAHPFLTGLTDPTTTIFGTATAITGAGNNLPTGSTEAATYGGGASHGLFVIPAGAAMFGANRGAAGADRIGYIRGNEGSWDSIGANGEQILRNIISAYDPSAGDDTDGDDLIDSFEQLIINADPNDAFATLADVEAGDDFDMDGLTNEDEHELSPRTNPANPDTDGDGIDDGPEVTGAQNPFGPNDPTNPSLADSDADGIDDNDEILIANGFITDPNNNDTDADTMPDGYEITNGQDPLADDSLSDPDNDMSTNLNEFTVGTDPNVLDTDGDGYKDGIETNDGSFDDIAMDTGTNPLDADTDDDGLEDGVETNSGTFTDANNTGTNPLADDSDNDLFRDGAEVNIHGTDPNVTASAPNTGLDVFFVGAGATINGNDAPAVAFLEDKYGIGNITYSQSTTTEAGDEAGFDLLVVSSTIQSTNGRGKFHNSTVPVVYWEQALNTNNDGDFGLTDAMTIGNNQTTMIDLIDHPITAGLPSPLSLWATGNSLVYYSNSLGDDVTAIATAVDGTAMGSPLFMVAETGAALFAGSGVVNDIAPARRVFLPFNDNSFGILSDDGYLLVGNAFDWAVGRLGASAPIEITDVTYDATSSPGDILMSITFDSESTKNYAIFATNDLAIEVPNRGDLDDSFPGEEGSTTFSFAFSAFGLDVNAEQMFFVVRENAAE